MTPVTAHQDHPIVLISYSDGPAVFAKNQQALAMGAANKGFIQIRTYTKRDIVPEFYEKIRILWIVPGERDTCCGNPM